MLDKAPRVLLHAEGLAVAVAAIALYIHGDHSWWLLVALVLTPDFSVVGYLSGPVVGAVAYNAAHTYVWPLVLVAVGVTADAGVATELGLIWFIHIGVDRTIGYGLKYPTGFKDTHLQRV